MWYIISEPHPVCHSKITWLCITVQCYSILFYPITLEGRWGNTDELATIPFHLDLFSAALVELAKSIPVHSLILSSHLFFCLPLFLFPFTVQCNDSLISTNKVPQTKLHGFSVPHKQVFRSNRPKYLHPVCSELQDSGIRVVVGDCSVTECRQWHPPGQTEKSVHAKTLQTQ